MKALEDKILKEGTVLPGNILKVGSFLNHQLDGDFLMEMGREIARLFAESGVTKIMTIESSGIAVAVAASAAMHVPAVFAKKHRTGMSQVKPIKPWFIPIRTELIMTLSWHGITFLLLTGC